MGKKKRKAKRPHQPSQQRQGIPLSPDVVEGLKEQFRRFEEKSIFFDVSADEPRPIIDEVVDQHMLEALHQAGVRPAIIYAYQKTGRLVTSENRKKLTKAELKEWTDAVDEWYDTHPEASDEEED